MRRTPLPAFLVGIAVTAVLAASAGIPGGGQGRGTETATPVAAVAGTRVLVISVDGLNPRALTSLGREGAPHIHRLMRQGAWSFNARSQVEQTETLPNHTSMVTGRRIDASHAGHGVDWNRHIPGTTVQSAARERVRSVFTVVKRAGGDTAIFSTKRKLSLFERSWPRAVGRSTIKEERNRALVRALRRDLIADDRAFTLLHLGLPDQVGHREAWLSQNYLRAVAYVDGLVGSIVRTIRNHRSLDSMVVVLTADHGGTPGTTRHVDPKKYANNRIPFIIWGPGVDHGDLYAMNPGYAEPGRSRVRFVGPQPIRNGDVANLALDLLGLGSVPDSQWNSDQGLNWHN